MRRPLDYDAPCGYELACRVDDLAEVGRCECVDLLVINGQYTCRECGTVYGVVFGYSKVVSYSRKQWRA